MNLYPNLESAKVISLDIETRDPDLLAKGPGVRRDGYMIGIAVTTDNGFSRYFPVAHDQGQNLSKPKTYAWLKKELSRSRQIKLGANLLYDFDYLYALGIKAPGLWYDVQIAEPLLNENRKVYNLDSLALEYLNRKKLSDPLQAYCDARGWKGKPQGHLWKMPPNLVGKYAIEDTRLPLKIFKKQKKRLIDQDLWDLFILETENLPFLLQMRQQGVPINVDKAQSLVKSYSSELERLKDQLKIDALWEAAAISKVFDKKHIKYPLTSKTEKPSFTKPWLEHHKHPFCRKLAKARTLDKFINTFLKSQILDLQINGKIHPMFNPLRSDDYGTVTGRFSGALPNLQFIPDSKSDPKKGPEIRSIFKPFGGETWGRIDYNQVELRILAHYAIGKGSAAIRRAYQKNPLTDYHQFCINITKLQRKAAKQIAFGIIYGMGVPGLCKQMGLTKAQGKKILAQYFGALPFVETTRNMASDVARSRGYVKTILGRRRRFNLFQPYDWNLAQILEARPNEQDMIDEVNEYLKTCKEHYKSGVVRAFTYRALNAVIQGTAADLMKKAMNDIYKSGVLNYLKCLITLHDELDFSFPKTKQAKQAFIEAKHIMEKAITFKIPIIADIEQGNNWGNLRKVKGGKDV